MPYSLGPRLCDILHLLNRLPSLTKGCETGKTGGVRDHARQASQTSIANEALTGGGSTALALQLQVDTCLGAVNV